MGFGIKSLYQVLFFLLLVTAVFNSCDTEEELTKLGGFGLGGSTNQDQVSCFALPNNSLTLEFKNIGTSEFILRLDGQDAASTCHPSQTPRIQFKKYSSGLVFHQVYIYPKEPPAMVDIELLSFSSCDDLADGTTGSLVLEKPDYLIPVEEFRACDKIGHKAYVTFSLESK